MLTARAFTLFICFELIVKAETEDDLLQQVAEHAQTAHGLEKVTEEIVAKVKSVIREE